MLSNQCYVPNYLYQNYASSIIWMDENNNQYHNPNFVWLKDRCYMVGDTYVVKRPNGTLSKTTKKPVAIGETENFYSGTHSNGTSTIFINKEVIKQYWATPLKLDDEILIPNGEEFVTFEGRDCRNIWKDTRMVPNGVDTRKAHPILDVIYKSLCGKDENASFEQMMQEAQEKNEFGWLMQWIANVYQCPGRKPETSLFLVGGYGTGKNTLVKVLTQLLGGPQWATDLKKEEIKRGWTSNIENKLIVFADEFSAESRTDTYEFIKEHTSEIQISVMERNKGQHPALGLAHWIFATNNLDNPVIVKLGDRRLTFIQSKDVSHSETEMKRWKEWVSKRVKTFMDEHSTSYDPEVIQAFANLLSNIEIDWDFINKPFETGLKKAIQRNSESGLERIVREFDDMVGDSPEDRVKNWWLWNFGEPGTDNFTRSQLMKELETFTKCGRAKISDFLRKHGYDSGEMFPKKRINGKGNPINHMKIEFDDWDDIEKLKIENDTQEPATLH